jgi:hypothetical protein
MKYLSMLLLTGILFALGACTAVDATPAATPEPPPAGLDPAPDAPQPDAPAPSPPEAPPVDEVTDAYPASTPVPPVVDDSYPAPPADVPPPADTGNDAAYPVEVDLGEITPQPPGGGDLQEMPRPGVPGGNTAVADLAVQALAERLNIDPGEIVVSNVEEREWPDSSLGCPAEGMMYMTVITPGYLIELDADGAPYTYHTDTDGTLVLCGEEGPLP